MSDSTQKLRCILLAVDHAPQLSQDIEEDGKGRQDIAKALLSGPHGTIILDYWWNAIRGCSEIGEVLLVCNADDEQRQFETWAVGAGFPLSNIVNAGSTLASNALGSPLAHLELVVRTKHLLDTPLLVIAADIMFQVGGKFELSDVLKYWGSKAGSDVAAYYDVQESGLTSAWSIMELDAHDDRVVGFLERPMASATARRASVVLYGLHSSSLQLLRPFLQQQQHSTLGSFMQHLVQHTQRTVYGYNLRHCSVQLVDVERPSCGESSSTVQPPPSSTGRYTARAYARVGIMGNPSDGFNGKTIAMTISNFWAEVSIEPSATLKLQPHPLNDPTQFGSLGELHSTSSRDGYQGGLRLLQATCKVFYQYCTTHRIALSGSNFTLQYSTNIPRQVGLAGSSAIVTAALRCLVAHYGLSYTHLPQPLRPQLVLDVEVQELGISAGLQDRVVQEYSGMVYMDFSKQLMERDGHGCYQRLELPDSASLPQFFLVYRHQPSDSGRIHNSVRARWNNGDRDVVEGMAELACMTEEARAAIQEARWDKLGCLMERNFMTRERLYGRQCLGSSNLDMIATGKRFGACVKFSGSGGAVLGLVSSCTRMEDLRAQYQADGCVVVDVIPYTAQQSSSPTEGVRHDTLRSNFTA